MAARNPRHLAERTRRFGLSRLQLVFLAAATALALLTGLIGVLARDQPRPQRPAASPTTTTQCGSAGNPTTTAPGQPIRTTPGNLLANADFERDLGGWAPLGGANLQRVREALSGGWAVAVDPGPDDAQPGLMVRKAATAKAGDTYEASVWVRAAAPGAGVVLALREQADGRVIGSDVAGYWLPDAGWRQLAVEHRARLPGSTLVLEITGAELPGDGRLLVDAVAVVAEE
jgi:hypothetical protein